MIGTAWAGAKDQLDQTESLLELSKVALRNESADAHSFVSAIVTEASRTVHDRIQAAADAESRARLAEAELERLRLCYAEAEAAQQMAKSEVVELERSLADADRQLRQLKTVTTTPYGLSRRRRLDKTSSLGSWDGSPPEEGSRRLVDTSFPPPSSPGATVSLNLSTTPVMLENTPHLPHGQPAPATRLCEPPSSTRRLVATQSAAYQRLQQRQIRREQRTKQLQHASCTEAHTNAAQEESFEPRRNNVGAPSSRQSYNCEDSGKRAGVERTNSLQDAKIRMQVRRQRRPI
eukprot:SAG31_NODE_11706_length_1005_cov_1.102649_1_plen_290_part_10